MATSTVLAMFLLYGKAVSYRATQYANGERVVRGTIKSYLEEKGYGFIAGDDGRDYFFRGSGFKNEQNRTEICDGLSVVFDGVPTPKGYRAKSIKFETDPCDLKFEVPFEVQISKGSEVHGWRMMEESSWRLVVSSRESIDDTRAELCRRAKKLGANALIRYRYSRKTGSEPGTGRGTHHYTIHQISAQASNVAKRSNEGLMQKIDFVDLDSRIANYLSKRRRWQKRLSLAALIVSFIVIMLLESPVLWSMIIACVISTVVYFYAACRWIRAI